VIATKFGSVFEESNPKSLGGKVIEFIIFYSIVGKLPNIILNIIWKTEI